MKELRFQTELELWVEQCAQCGCGRKLHTVDNFDCQLFVHRTLPTKKALKRAETVIENPNVDDVVAIARLIDELTHTSP